ncbi:extracellular solute-binding protein, partial [Candidatus Gottesmanbacteria bacterium]|nr:extracellular solute-binding protein [Candidatus Gottesmanbacteria bacterium]
KKVTVPDAVTGRIKTAGVALGTTNNIEFWSDILGLMFYQNGANPYNPTNAFAEETLLFYSLFAQPPDNVWDSNMDNSMVAFMSGKLAMMFAPSWLAIEITQANPDLKFKIVPVPQLPETPMVTWGSYWVEGVSAKSASQKEAFDFLAFLVARENLTKLYNEEAKTRIVGEPYSRVDLAQALIDHPLLGAYVVQGPNARSGYLSDRTMDNGINDRIIQYYKNAVNAVLAGSSPNQALTTAAQGITQILSQFGVASQ